MAKLNLYNFTIDNETFLYTNYDKDFISNGLTYKSIRIERSNILSTVSDDKAVVSISVANTNEVVDFFRDGLPYSTITISIREIPDTNFPDVYQPLFFGEVSGCERELNIATFTCNPLSVLLNTRITRRTEQSNCNNFLYFGRCKLNILDFRFLVNIIDIKNNGTTLKVSSLIPSGGDHTVYKLKSGIITFGKQNKMITSVDELNNEINLLTKINNLNIGDSVYLAPGCDRTSNRCKELNNFENFDGEEFVPYRNKFLGT